MVLLGTLFGLLVIAFATGMLFGYLLRDNHIAREEARDRAFNHRQMYEALNVDPEPTEIRLTPEQVAKPPQPRDPDETYPLM